MTDQDRNYVVAKVKSKGFWEINVRPTMYKENRIPKERIKDLIRGAVVELRGWDYPHFRGGNNTEPYPIQNGIENWIDWYNHIEFWRMTCSGNFLHLLALAADWTDSKKYKNIWSRGDELQGKQVLGILSALYTLTEVFEFSKRLASQGVFDDTLVIELKLHKIANRVLVVDSYNRTPFFHDYAAHVDEWSYSRKEYSVNDLLGQSSDFALHAFKDLVWLFGWENPPVDSFQNDQQKFLKGRI